MTHSTMAACVACGWLGRPRRLWCPRCGGGMWAEAPLPDAKVLATTEVRRGLGGVVDPPEVTCLVVTSDGAMFIARCLEAPAPKVGDTVSLTLDGGLVAQVVRRSSRARTGARRKLGP